MAQLRLLRWHIQRRLLTLTGGRHVSGRPVGWDDWGFSDKLRWRCTHPDPALDYPVWVNKYYSKLLTSELFKSAETYQYATGLKEIRFTALPDTYVMKAAHAWGMCLLVRNGFASANNKEIFENGEAVDEQYLRNIAASWLASKREQMRRYNELHYSLVSPGILFEQFLDPVDFEYQFFLFRGECKLTMIIYRGFVHTLGVKHRLYDQNWNRLQPGTKEAERSYFDDIDETPAPPAKLMDDLKLLCRDIDHVRADFYFSRGECYFGEFTFTHAAGSAGLLGKYDAELGRAWA